MIKKIKTLLPAENLHVNLSGLNNRFEKICVFDSNIGANERRHLQFSKLIAIGSNSELKIHSPGKALEQLQKLYDSRKGWLFGYLSYDLKNEIEQVHSKNEDHLGFPVLHFFSPSVVIQVIDTDVTIFYDDDFLREHEARDIYTFAFSPETVISARSGDITVQAKVSKKEYIKTVNALKQHIRRGDIYEVNFCQEFYAMNAEINPPLIYEKLNAISQAPFSTFSKFDSRFLLCASPERFLRKNNNKLTSQPIKGTGKRFEDKLKDEQSKKRLQNDLKERSENVMIVDLVRNDLSRIAKRGTVNVEEYQTIYSYRQVHQMVSTISCELKEEISFTDIIKSMFPMGSMTGAPKVSSMKLIEEFETTKRSLYSGTIGYISPEGDFDFNVVIRSILYNSENKYLSFMVGSAITDLANAEEEYNECLLKANAMFEVLTSTHKFAE